MRRTIGLVFLLLAGALTGLCGANSARADSPGQVWSFSTPFGILYGIIPRGERIGPRIVGSLKSQPALNVQARYEK